MSDTIYYPEQTIIIGMATIRRERKAPPNTIAEVQVRPNSQVEPATVVLRAAAPGGAILLDVLKPLGLKDVIEITEDSILVRPGEVVDEGQHLITVGKGRSMKAVEAPCRAIYSRLDGSKMILQTNPEPIEVLALSPGIVTAVREDNTVLIESYGALLQGAWGNGKSTYAPLALEPEEGIESLRGDEMLQDHTGVAMIMRGPITSLNVFSVAAAQGIAALIAPSMRSNLRQPALNASIPVFLTSGFGEAQMSEIVYNLLRGNLNRSATIDAVTPTRWEAERPEIVIPLSSGGAKPRAPEKNQPLSEGALVRVTRDPYAGVTGRVRRLPEAPRIVENGLRLAGAEIELPGDQIAFVPLANLELLGRPADAPGKS